MRLDLPVPACELADTAHLPNHHTRRTDRRAQRDVVRTHIPHPKQAPFALSLVLVRCTGRSALGFGDGDVAAHRRGMSDGKRRGWGGKVRGLRWSGGWSDRV